MVGSPRVRVFISYAQDDDRHVRLVRRFWEFLRRVGGVDARMDLPDAERPQDWPVWMQEQIENSDYVLVVVSPAYKERAEARTPVDVGRGVRWEARLIRELSYADQDAGLVKVLPVVLPGRSAAEIPCWLGSTSRTHYMVRDFTAAGAEALLRYLTGQPHEVYVPPGPVPAFPRRGPDPLLNAEAPAGGGRAAPLDAQSPPSAARPPPVWNVPGRLVTFTGRGGLLQDIHRELNADGRVAVTGIGSVTALHGLGGVGKTQLAIEYAWRQRSEYALVWWIDAEQETLIREQMAALAVPLRLRVTGQVAQDAAAVLDALRQRDGWLLIFDNVENAQSIRRWIPAGGHVLITSRSPVWGAIATRIPVDVMLRADTTLLLSHRLAGLDPHIADALAEELGDLPLAVEQAAAYLETTGMTPAAYLDRFRTRRDAMLSRGRDLAYGGSVDTAWIMAFDRLQQYAPAAVQLLELCAQLGPDPIPLILIGEHADLLSDPLRAVVAGADPELDLDDVIGAILNYSLARRNADTVQLHRLVAAVIRAHQTAPARRAAARTVRRLLQATVAISPADPVGWPIWMSLASHLMAAPALHVDDPGIDLDEGSYDLLLQTSFYLGARADYRAAYAFDRDQHRRCHRLFGGEHLRTLRFANRVAVDLHALGDLHAAREVNEAALAACRRVLGDDHPETLESANNLAGLLPRLGELDAARQLNEETLDRKRRVLGADHPDTLKTASNLATTLAGLGDLDAARELLQHTSAGRRRVLGPDHPEALFSAKILADVLSRLGEHRSAHRLLDEIVGRYRHVLGPDHPWTLMSASSLARVLRDLGERGAARDLAMDTARRHRRHRGTDFSTPNLIRTLANVLRSVGEDEEASRLEREFRSRGGGDPDG